MAALVALVTGGGAWIGRATARRLGKRGRPSAWRTSTRGAAASTAAQIEARGGSAWCVRADVSRGADVRAMIDSTVTELGGLDILVNNAGIVTTPAFPDAEPDDWMRVLDVNLRGPMLGTHYAIRAMRERGGGAIVNIASLAGVGLGTPPVTRLRGDEGRDRAGCSSAALAPLRETDGIRV